MKIRSLGYQTDLIFAVFDGKIIDKGDHLVIKSPDNPDFYWGNFLLFSQPPRMGDFVHWRYLFENEIGLIPQVKHQVFGWDSPEGEVGEIKDFLTYGFRLVQSVVLIAEEPHPPAQPNHNIIVRSINTSEDWDQALENQIICREPDHSEYDYRLFKVPQMERYRRMQAAGLGRWYGAFIGNRLVADLGIFHQEGIGRYQSVGTHPDFRRQGIAATLVYQAATLAKKESGLDKLVIVAEENSSPARIYQSVGFMPEEKQVGLEWWMGIQNDDQIEKDHQKLNE